MRVRITKELIERKGFSIVAVEADWPDAAHLNRYLREGCFEMPEDRPFTRFPTWMWANREVLDFLRCM